MIRNEMSAVVVSNQQIYYEKYFVILVIFDEMKWMNIKSIIYFLSTYE